MTTTYTKRTKPSSTPYSVRSKPSTNWDMRDSLGRIWAEMDDTWAETIQTWAELGSTNYTNRVKP